jgi:hypothetical protein
MEMLLGSILGFILGIGISILAVRWIAHRVIDRIADSIAQGQEESSEAKKLKLKLEFDQNNYFMYNVTDGSFVVQGESIAQVRERLRERFPDYDATVVDGDPDAVAKLKKEIELYPDENSNSVRSTS